MTPTDDALIMQRVQRGEFGWFDVLVARYERPLLSVAVSKLGNRTTAEDVVQETFLAVFAARHTYQPRFAFRTWLWTILLNLCRKHYRRSESGPRVVSTSQALSSADEPMDHETALARLLQVERRDMVQDLLAALPETQADALRLRFFGGLQFSEIAETMACSLSGAKRRVQTGLLKLAELLRDTDEHREFHPHDDATKTSGPTPGERTTS